MTSNEGSDHHNHVSERILERIADESGRSPTDLDPLYDVVDPDALDCLFASTTSANRSEGRVTFDYHGYTVTVHGDGRLDIEYREYPST